MSQDPVRKALTELYRASWKHAQICISRRHSLKALKKDSLYTHAVRECRSVSDAIVAYRKGTIPTVQHLLIRKQRFFMQEIRVLTNALEEHARRSLRGSSVDRDEYLEARLQSKLLHDELCEAQAMMQMVGEAMLVLKQLQDAKRARS